jgi:hypothetical protein
MYTYIYVDSSNLLSCYTVITNSNAINQLLINEKGLLKISKDVLSQNFLSLRSLCPQGQPGLRKIYTELVLSSGRYVPMTSFPDDVFAENFLSRMFCFRIFCLQTFVLEDALSQDVCLYFYILCVFASWKG